MHDQTEGDDDLRQFEDEVMDPFRRFVGELVDQGLCLDAHSVSMYAEQVRLMYRTAHPEAKVFYKIQVERTIETCGLSRGREHIFRIASDEQQMLTRYKQQMIERYESRLARRHASTPELELQAA